MKPVSPRCYRHVRRTATSDSDSYHPHQDRGLNKCRDLLCTGPYVLNPLISSIYFPAPWKLLDIVQEGPARCPLPRSKHHSKTIQSAVIAGTSETSQSRSPALYKKALHTTSPPHALTSHSPSCSPSLLYLPLSSLPRWSWPDLQISAKK